MDYIIDKGEYLCTCKAQKPEYFPCHEGFVDCTTCGYAKKKEIEEINRCCVCKEIVPAPSIQASEDGMMCGICYRARFCSYE